MKHTTEFPMATKYAEADLADALARIDAGEAFEAVLADTGLGRGALWLYQAWTAAKAAGTLVDLAAMGGAKADATVAQMRANGDSWGTIMARCGITETAARKHYERATNIQSVGTRIGKGGRYWADDEELYLGEGAHGDRTAHGPSVPVGTNHHAARAMVEGTMRDLNSLKKAELAELLGDATLVKAHTKAELVELAMAATA